MHEDDFYEKHVSNGGVLYFMLMLPSKVMPYLIRLAAPLMDSSIVHCTFEQPSRKLKSVNKNMMQIKNASYILHLMEHN